MADYTGSRRAIEPMSPALAARVFAEDDAAVTCPECGAGVRPGQEWCSLCMHVLRQPEREAVAAPRPVVSLQTPMAVAASTPAADADLSAELSAEVSADGPTAEVRAQVEAAADALLAQLAVESSHNRLSVPEYLNSRSRVAVFVAVAMTVLGVLGVATLAVVGSVFS